MTTCRFLGCVHKSYCHIDGEKWDGLCVVIHKDPTVLGLTEVDSRTLQSAIIFLRAKLKHLKCKKTNWKTAFELWKGEKYHG